MDHSPSDGDRGITRRGFLLGTAAGLGVGAPLAWYGLDWLRRHQGGQPELSPFTGRTQEASSPRFAMPGPFPGRVVEVHHPGSVSPDHRIYPEAVRAMMGRGMCGLTGADHPQEAWQRFFERGDVVGIKVNPVGRAPKPGEPGRVAGAVGSISSPAVLLEVVRGLKSAGVKPNDVIVFERYAEEFCDAGYEQVMREREMDGVRWYASAVRYDRSQVSIDGFDGGRSSCSPEMARHVVGYDPDVFAHMGFAGPQHDPRDDRRFRSHLSVIVSRLVNKIVTIPCLKDHRSAGVTLALKNLSHGLNNNVARSHLSGIDRLDGTTSGPNQCNTFIPTAVAQSPTRQKATLHILDGLIGVYEGGPGNWNRTWGTWRARSLFFATDPVALDHVGWDLLDAKRALEGWRPVAQMGVLGRAPAVTFSPRLAALAALGTPEAAALSLARHRDIPDGSATEIFDRREPEHVILAGVLGLGTWDARAIEHRRMVVVG
jgi:uncharacterized protein (DUF362 family)